MRKDWRSSGMAKMEPQRQSTDRRSDGKEKRRTAELSDGDALMERQRLRTVKDRCAMAKRSGAVNGTATAWQWLPRDGIAKPGKAKLGMAKALRVGEKHRQGTDESAQQSTATAMRCDDV